MEDAPRLRTFPISECPDRCIRLPRHKWRTSLSNMEYPVVLLERTLYGHPLGWPLVGKTVPGSFNGTWMAEVPNWECLFVHRKQGSLLSVYVDDI